MGQGLLISPQAANPLPNLGHFLGKKRLGVFPPPLILFSSARCFLYKCFVLPVHFGGWPFLSPPPPRPLPSLSLASSPWEQLGWGPWVFPTPTLSFCLFSLQLAVLLFNIAPKVF